MKDRTEILAEARRTGVLTSDDRVARDVLCIECEYNTRTLAFDSDCPECNTPVVRTLDARIFVPQQWLERVARGATMLALSMTFFLVFTILALAKLLGANVNIGSASPTVLAFLGAGLFLAGLLLVTVKPPETLAERTALNVRQGARLAAITAVIAVIVPLLFQRFDLAEVIVGTLGVAACLLLPLLLIQHLAIVIQFAGRVALARHLRVAAWVALAVSAGYLGVLLWLGKKGIFSTVAATAVLAVILAGSLFAAFLPAAIGLNRTAWPDSPSASSQPERDSNSEL